MLNAPLQMTFKLFHALFMNTVSTCSGSSVFTEINVYFVTINIIHCLNSKCQCYLLTRSIKMAAKHIYYPVLLASCLKSMSHIKLAYRYM